MLTFKNKFSFGFTIVELLVAVVVITILAGIVYISYEGYEKNAQSSQVASTVSAYKEAVRTGVQFETDDTPQYNAANGDFLATCVTSNTNRCCFYQYVIQMIETTTCANNTELQADGYISNSYVYDIVDKYTNKKKSQLPNFNDYGGRWTKCQAKGENGRQIFYPPCYTNEIAYTNELLVGESKGFLHYYLPSRFDSCYSNDVVVFDDADNYEEGSYNGTPYEDNDNSFIGISKTAKYTKRITTGDYPITYCMISIEKDYN